MTENMANNLILQVDKPLDLQYSLPMTIKEKSSVEVHPEPSLDEDLDFFTSGMAATGGSSPYIKDEPEEFSFLQNFPPNQQNFDMQMGQQFGQPQPQSSNMNTPNMSVQNGTYGQYNVAPRQNMTNSFNMGNSGISDEDLLDLDLNDAGQHHNYAQNQQSLTQQGSTMPFFSNQGQNANNRQINQQYSSTPDGQPIQSPFTHGNFNYAGFTMQQKMPQTSPQVRPATGNAASYIGGRPTSHMAPQMNRQPSDSRSPMTPRTPGVAGLHLETSQAGSVPSQPINYNNQQQKRTSGQWDSNPDSLHSHADTPISSPGFQPNHAQISEILKSGKHASLPAKVEPGHHGFTNSQSQEAKRRRRRESHNLVERRRRDNINEKIQELSHLVPQHRLEDEKVRKHILNNSPLSPILGATGISPPQATSLLAGGGRRATSGSISLGIPPEEKDKGPNKGDILNGSVSWTRDLMWALFQKYQQEDELAETLTTLGQPWPFQQLEEDKRMRTELLAAMESNNPMSFAYSRGPGSGLRVPNHTNAAGDSLDLSHMGTISPQSLSPGDHGGHNMGDINGMGGNQQYWDHTFKEEDEYGMEMH